MTKAPDNIPKFVGTDDQLINAMKHMLTRGNLTLTDKSVVAEAVDTIESMRADLHAELAKAADALAEALEYAEECYSAPYDTCLNHSRELRIKALTAYKQAKEKLNG